METINYKTKTGRRYLSLYANAKCTTLAQAYKRPSVRKTQADYFCRAQMAKENGYYYKIISHNCQFFSAAWRTDD